MEITEESLRQHYSNLSTDELVEIERTSDLTELASRVIEEIFAERSISHEQKQNIILESKNNEEYIIGFQWWVIWAWLGLVPGNLMVIVALQSAIDLAIIVVVINSVLMIMILKYNKYAFLIATIFSFNPLLWIINGIYLKNRWGIQK